MCQKVRMGLLLYLRSWVAVTACSLTMISGAQYEVGASFGLYHDALQGRRSEGYSYAEFDDLPVISLVASIHYRERCSSRTDLGVELQFVRKSFSVLAREGGLAGSSGIDADVSLYLMHLNITPEVKMNESGSIRLRFGPQFGFKLGGSVTGQKWVSYPFNYSTDTLARSAPSDLKGDIRFLFGMGFRSNALSKWAVTCDPYYSVAIGSILKIRPGAKGSDLGIKIGLTKRVDRRTLTQWIDKRMPTPPPGPNW